MKRKHRLGKGISLLLVISLLLGVTVVGTLAEDSGAGDAVAQSETVAFPWDGYTRITMADYGITASTDAEGTPYTSAQGKTTTKSMRKSYIDVDICIKDDFAKLSFMDYLGSGDWTDGFRMKQNDEGKLAFVDSASSKRANAVDVDLTTYTPTANEFFNLKILTDIVTNANNSGKNDVTVQYYVNENYAGTMTWTENKDKGHGYLYFNCTSYSLRTPTLETTVDPWTGYSRLTIDKYGIPASIEQAGTLYKTSQTGTYTGCLDKTYLDVDVNFNGTFDGQNYLHYFGHGAWADIIRLKPENAGTEISITDWYNPGDGYKARDSIANIEIEDYKISADKFFNLKILTEIAPNKGSTTQRITLQFYLNNVHAGTMTWDESVGTDHSYFYFYCSSGSFSLRTPILPEEIDYRYEISDYRKTTVDATMGGVMDKYYEDYPEKTGYVFGGWYSDVYLTEPLDFSVTTGYAYAKFVPEKVLTVKFQKLANASKTDKTTSLRAITAVDSLEYEYVGFKRVVDGDVNTEKVYTTRSVFKTIKGTMGSESYTYTPSVISDNAKYLMALSINNIPDTVYESTITITPLWKTLDGTVVTGEPRDTQLFDDTVVGGTTLYGGDAFANDNEAYYKNSWIY